MFLILTVLLLNTWGHASKLCWKWTLLQFLVLTWAMGSSFTLQFYLLIIMERVVTIFLGAFFISASECNAVQLVHSFLLLPIVCGAALSNSHFSSALTFTTDFSSVGTLSFEYDFQRNIMYSFWTFPVVGSGHVQLQFQWWCCQYLPGQTLLLYLILIHSCLAWWQTFVYLFVYMENLKLNFTLVCEN